MPEIPPVGYRDDQEVGQRTVVTASLGELHRKRIVRGRDAECASHHRADRAAPSEQG